MPCHKNKSSDNADNISQAIRAAEQTKKSKKYRLEDVQKHNKKEDCWVIVNGQVYDVTGLIETHSGGSGVIESICGQDATSMFEGKPHSEQASKELERYKIGVLEE